MRPLEAVVAEARARWAAQAAVDPHAAEVTRTRCGGRASRGGEPRLTPWQPDEVVVREHLATHAPAVPGADVAGRRVRRALAATVSALASTGSADGAAALAAMWPTLRDLDPVGWQLVAEMLPDPLAAPMAALVAALPGGGDPLAAACAEVHAAAALAVGADPAAARDAERRLQAHDDVQEALHLGQQDGGEEGLALALRLGARLLLDVIEVLGVAADPLEAEAVALLRRLPEDPAAWLEQTAPLSARARATARGDAAAVLAEATTPLVLLALALLATDDAEVVRWCTAEAGAAWSRLRGAAEALRAGEGLSLAVDPDAALVLQEDRAECWSLAHLQGSEARWDAFLAELAETSDRLVRGEVADPRAAWAHVARWASLDGVPPELQGVPLAVGLRLQELSRAMAARRDPSP
ncbi:MAG: hypothetical protein R3F59_27700 [Myxococcota bacterium]